VVLNNSAKAQSISLPLVPGKKFTDVLTNLNIRHNADSLKLTVPAKWGAILQSE
jgi:hypothetical protein